MHGVPSTTSSFGSYQGCPLFGNNQSTHWLLRNSQKPTSWRLQLADIQAITIGNSGTIIDFGGGDVLVLNHVSPGP
jgi:hypothetical protein